MKEEAKSKHCAEVYCEEQLRAWVWNVVGSGHRRGQVDGRGPRSVSFQRAQEATGGVYAEGWGHLTNFAEGHWLLKWIWIIHGAGIKAGTLSHFAVVQVRDDGSAWTWGSSLSLLRLFPHVNVRIMRPMYQLVLGGLNDRTSWVHLAKHCGADSFRRSSSEFYKHTHNIKIVPLFQESVYFMFSQSFVFSVKYVFHINCIFQHKYVSLTLCPTPNSQTCDGSL